MANARLNIFENYNLVHDVVTRGFAGIGSIQINLANIMGSISFNNIAVILTVSMTGGTNSLTYSFGLYSLNGSTLSLANSASFSSTFSTSAFQWITFATSTTQDITPGNWYFVLMGSSSGTTSVGLINNNAILNFGDRGYGGPFFRGKFSATSNALPVSMATSNCFKEGAVVDNVRTFQPYILISA